MKCKKLLSVFFILISVGVYAQTQDYWVFFKDKNNVDFNPENYFDTKALERRDLQGISIDTRDFPCNIDYVESVGKVASECVGSSRWFNASYVKATENQIKQISQFEFVSSIKEAVVWNESPYAEKEVEDEDVETPLLVQEQLELFHPEILKTKELDGSNVRIAILDGGFPSVDTHDAFEHLRKAKRILKTWDFVKNEENVYHGNHHGTMVLSCVAGKYKGINMGLAQDAEFILARTEKSFEPFKEEIYWVEALEWADKEGADIINSSLGYTFNRYFPQDMDGKTSLISAAANTAAAKGILLVNAAGNEGTDKWHVIGAPADADSILSIGGVNPKTYLHINFSSYGPTADGRLKPNICGSGLAFVADSKGGYTQAYGTSFASPLTCGFAACAKEAFPDISVMELKEKLEKSASLYPYFDYAHGYGIPNANKLFSDVRTEKNVTLKEENGNVIVSLSKNEFQNLDVHASSVLFYHIQNTNGQLDSYKVIRVFKQDVVSIPLKKLEGKTLSVHYKNYTLTKEF